MHPTNTIGNNNSLMVDSMEGKKSKTLAYWIFMIKSEFFCFKRIFFVPRDEGYHRRSGGSGPPGGDFPNSEESSAAAAACSGKLYMGSPSASQVDELLKWRRGHSDLPELQPSKHLKNGSMWALFLWATQSPYSNYKSHFTQNARTSSPITRNLEFPHLKKLNTGVVSILL